MARRLAGRHGYPEAPNHFNVTPRPDRLDEPLRWRKPRRVFVCSMSDLFHEDVPHSYVRSIFERIHRTPRHTYIILTKRPDRMRAFFANNTNVRKELDLRGRYSGGGLAKLPLSNVWLGVTIEKSEYSYRADYLRRIPAAVKFISFEPLLGSFADHPGVLDNIDWVIAGGESGPGARPMHPDWARSLRDQCQEAGVPYFHKQNGIYAPLPGCDDSCGRCVMAMPDGTITGTDWEPGSHNTSAIQMHPVGKKRAGRLLDGREWNEMPER